MRTLRPNSDREDALETVLEVPLPDENGSFPLSPSAIGTREHNAMLKKVKTWMRSQLTTDRSSTPSSLGRGAELQLMLGVIGAPLLPHPLNCHSSITGSAIKDNPIEASMAKYIVQQYVAAAGGEEALSKVRNMYAMGKLHTKMKSSSRSTATHGGGEMGGFVIWQQRPNLWCIELLLSGCKITAGSDGKVAWRQTPWQQAHASRGPPRPLRRCIQGLDPRSTADLFSDAVWVGEKTISGHDCFVLRVDTNVDSLRSRSSSKAEVVQHTMWGYFSQKTGLLVQIEDSQLLKIQGEDDKETVLWETNMESYLGDYRTINGVNIAHSGHTSASLLRYGGADGGSGHTKSLMEETWEIEEVDFNIMGLSMECFLPPADLDKDQPQDKKADKERKTEKKESSDMSGKGNNARPLTFGGVKAQSGAIAWFGPVRVMAIDSEDPESAQDGDHEMP